MAYSELMVKKHNEVIEKCKTASETSKDSEIKAFATGRLSVLKTHLEEAEKCVEKCK